MVFLVRGNKILEPYLWESDRFGRQEFEPVLDIVGSTDLAAEDVETEFSPFVTSAKTDEEALEALLAVQNETFLAFVIGHVEIRNLKGALPVFNELAMADRALGLPDEEGADRVLAKD
jgi:hypothetical protein